jgi:hypothetical protein
MRRILILSLLMLAVLVVHAQKAKQVPLKYNVHIKIPSAWITKLRHYSYKQSNAALLREFDGFLKPDSLFMPDYNKGLDKNKGGILNPMFTDLDGKPGDELICLLGWDKNYPSMGVFKRIQNTWYLLYLREFYMFYSMPELNVANSYSKNKTFYYRTVYERGSGVYSDGYCFYKLIHNKVYPCLNLMNEAHISGWGLAMNQEVTATFKVNGGNVDEIWAYYKYDFVSAMSTGDTCAPDYVSVVKGEEGMNYKWDSKMRIYKPEVYSYHTAGELTLKKILCFGDFGNDSLFVGAFNYEIKQTLKTGTRKQKAVLKQYLTQLKQKKTATTL